MTTIALLTRLVRTPESLAAEADGPEFPHLVRRLFLTTVLSALALGFVIGVHHSMLQGLNAAVKLPFVFMLPALLGAPAVVALADLFGTPVSFRRAAVAGLAACTRVAVFAVSVAPVMWLGTTLDGRYRTIALATVFVLGFAGLSALRVLTRLTPRGLALGLSSAVVFAAATAQTGWLLRPFILRRHLEPTFMEAPESDVFTEIGGRVTGRPESAL